MEIELIFLSSVIKRRMEIEKITFGTKELYRMFSLPPPLINRDINSIRVDVLPEMTDEQLINYLINGMDIVCNAESKLNPSSS